MCKYLNPEIVEKYNEIIDKVVPGYWTLLNKIVENLHLNEEKKIKILELGAGTGNLTLCLLFKRNFSRIKIFCYDISPFMVRKLKQLKEMLSENRIVIKQADVTKVNIKGKYCAIISSLLFHELKENQRFKVIKKSYNMLEKGGSFIMADFVSFGPKNEILFKKWYQDMINAGVSQKDALIEIYTHRKERYTLEDYLNMLTKAGFVELKCVHKHLNYVVLCGIK